MVIFLLRYYEQLFEEITLILVRFICGECLELLVEYFLLVIDTCCWLLDRFP